jgi:hypothetical protein
MSYDVFLSHSHVDKHYADAICHCLERTGVRCWAGLFLTFRNAHRVNWHEHWLGLRFHAEFPRCLPVLAAAAQERAPRWLHGRARAAIDAEDAPLPPHLAALTGHGHATEDPRAIAHGHAQHEVRATLLDKLDRICRDDPWTYTMTTLDYARQLARQQLRYHCRRAQEERVIVHRVHAISLAGFAVTIGAVMAHLVWHLPILTMVSTGVPAGLRGPGRVRAPDGIVRVDGAAAGCVAEQHGSRRCRHRGSAGASVEPGGTADVRSP